MEELQSPLSNKVLEAGSKNEIAFIKNSFSHIPIKTLKHPHTKPVLGAIFTSASALAGIKDGVQDLVKKDLIDLVFQRFSNLSIEEIYYAFKLERQLAYPTKTEHYQFFSTEYVAEILSKYREYKQEKMRIHNINLPKKEIALPPRNEKEDSFEFLKWCYSEWKQTGKLPYGATIIYPMLYKMGVLPPHTEQYREQVHNMAINQLKHQQAEKRTLENRKEWKVITQLLKNIDTNSGAYKNATRSIVMKDFFKNVKTKKLDLRELFEANYSKVPQVKQKPVK